ncbi:ras-interacting protein RIP3-like [Carcharodon carcharias]|uniref:ras-interacting protein RIP3-like n=1 Tax=Carcharodon carcharias TaxID=13397 RepID=UPI001B7DA13E|nr:ras-interacting protein RIP3-like [Carcharodon carcharias]
MDVNGVSQCRENGSSEPIPHAQGSGGSGCQQQQQQQQQDGQQEESATASDSHSQEKRQANDQEDKKRVSTTKTAGAPSYSRWSSTQPHQPGPAVRTYQNSKARVTMSPGFTPQWNNNQSAWNSYTYPRANVHYQSHASYSYCPGHPASTELNYSSFPKGV